MNKRLKALIICILTIIPGFTISQTTLFDELYNKADYPFILYQPKQSTPEEKKPLIIFLHGRSLSGNDLNLLKRYGVIDAIEKGRNIDAFVIAPQVRKSENWNPDKVLSVLNYTKNNYNIDSNRVYVVGMSLGGYGTMHFAGKYPEKVAAAVALCGGGNLTDACNLAEINLWIGHGKKDKAVPYSESTKMYDAIKSCNPNSACFLTLYPDWGHGEPSREFYKDTLYSWLFQFSKNSSDSTVKPEALATIKTYNSETKSDQMSEATINKSISQGSVSKSKNNSKKKNIYVVKKGENLYRIAQKHNTTVSNLLLLNGLNENSTLQIGQKIKIG